MTAHPIARERLLRDHFEDRPRSMYAPSGGEATPCAGCARAYAVRLEIAALTRKAGKA